MGLTFGMPTLLELEDLERNAALCRELGLSFIELNMNFPQYQPEQLKNTAFFEGIARQYGVSFTIHLDENLNVCDFNPIVREAYLDTVRQVIVCAREMRARVINLHMHPGIYITLPGRKAYLYDKYKERYLDGIRAFGRMCGELAQGQVLLCVENTGGYADFQKEAIEILLESPDFALTWDIGHSHAAGDIDAPFILAHEGRLIHFHIHDALAKQNHLPLGTGEIDLAARLAVAQRNNCRCVLETKTEAALRQSVEWLRGRGYL